MKCDLPGSLIKFERFIWINKMKVFLVFSLSAIMATVAMGITAHAAPRSLVAAPRPESASDDTDLRVTDPHKELRHLSKNLKLKKDQRIGVNSILEERAREIRLLLDVESLSQAYREELAAKVVKDSDAQIENLLRSKQKVKFDKELAKDHDIR